MPGRPWTLLPTPRQRDITHDVLSAWRRQFGRRTDRNIADKRIGIDLQAVFFRELLDLFACFLALDEAKLRRLGAEDDGVEHGEHVK